MMTNNQNSAMALVIVSALALGTAALIHYSKPAPLIQLQATTTTGDLYIVGSGDTCAHAWEGADLPAGWQTVQCVVVQCGTDSECEGIE